MRDSRAVQWGTWLLVLAIGAAWFLLRCAPAESGQSGALAGPASLEADDVVASPAGPVGAPITRAAESGTESDPVWTLVVLDRVTGHAIQDAELALQSGVSTRLLGRSGVDGSWTGDFPDSTPPWTIRARADGYLIHQEACDRSTMRLELEPAGKILGRVVGADPVLFAEGAFVAAAWASGRADVADAAADPAPSPLAARAIVRPDGSFELSGLRRSWQYTVIAVGPAFGTPDPVLHVLADGREVRVEVMPLRAARLRVTGPNGDALRSGSGVYQELPHSASRPSSSRARFSFASDPSLRLLGIVESQTDLESTRALACFYLPEGESPDFFVSIVRAGYHAKSITLAVPRAHVPLEEIAIELEPWAKEFGTLDLTWRMNYSVEERDETDGSTPDAVVSFFAAKMRVPSTQLPLIFSKALRDLSHGRARLGPIPVGEYQVAMTDPFTEPEFDPDVRSSRTILIEPDATTPFEADLTGHGMLSFECREAGEPYLGAVTFYLERDGGSVPFALSARARRVPLLSPGVYQLNWPAGFRGLAPNEAVARPAITITGGQVTHLTLNLPEQR